MCSATGVAKKEAIGVTMQQFQKYGTAANRISVSRMLLVADVLNTHPSEIILGAFKDALAEPQQGQIQIVENSISADPKRTVRALIDLFQGLQRIGAEVSRGFPPFGRTSPSADSIGHRPGFETGLWQVW